MEVCTFLKKKIEKKFSKIWERGGESVEIAPLSLVERTDCIKFRDFFKKSISEEPRGPTMP